MKTRMNNLKKKTPAVKCRRHTWQEYYFGGMLREGGGVPSLAGSADLLGVVGLESLQPMFPAASNAPSKAIDTIFFIVVPFKWQISASGLFLFTFVHLVSFGLRRRSGWCCRSLLVILLRRGLRWIAATGQTDQASGQTKRHELFHGTVLGVETGNPPRLAFGFHYETRY